MLRWCNRVWCRAQQGHSFLELCGQGPGATPEFLPQSRSHSPCIAGHTANSVALSIRWKYLRRANPTLLKTKGFDQLSSLEVNDYLPVYVKDRRDEIATSPLSHLGLCGWCGTHVDLDIGHAVSIKEAAR